MQVYISRMIYAVIDWGLCARMLGSGVGGVEGGSSAFSSWNLVSTSVAAPSAGGVVGIIVAPRGIGCGTG